MAADLAVFDEMKSFLEFEDSDASHLKALAPVFEKHGGAITDRFYETLAHYDTTAALIEGRVDSLKATHHRWMAELFSGEYGEDYFTNRMRIGEVHVRIGLPPYYVEAVMNVIRTEGLVAVMTEMSDANVARDHYRSLLKILDLDLLVINLAYSEERLDRMSSFTGMSRKLIENVITRAKK